MVDWFMVWVGVVSLGFTVTTGMAAWMAISNNEEIKAMRLDLLSIAKRLDLAIKEMEKK
jgi:hypothetical protein